MPPSTSFFTHHLSTRLNVHLACTLVSDSYVVIPKRAPHFHDLFPSDMGAYVASNSCSTHEATVTIPVPWPWHHWATDPEGGHPDPETDAHWGHWHITSSVGVSVPVPQVLFPYFLAFTRLCPTFWHQSSNAPRAVSQGISFVFLWLRIYCLILFDL